MNDASMYFRDYIGPVLAVAVLGTVVIQFYLLLFGLKNRKMPAIVESNRWWIGAVSLWTLSLGGISFLGALWGKHSAVSISPEGASAISSSAFLYLQDITEAIPRLYVVIAVFLIGVTCSMVLRLAAQMEPPDKPSVKPERNGSNPAKQPTAPN